MSDATHPNLVYVFADQLRRSACGFAGDERARTPRIDALAREGVEFRNAVSGHPVCAPYRASLFTGKYSSSTGMVINELRMNTSHECFAHVLKRAGYDVPYIGKWHLYANQLGHHDDPRNSHIPRGPDRLGFDDYWAAYNFHHRYYDTYYHEESPEKMAYPEGAYEPDAQTDMAIAQLRQAARRESPFALFLSLGTPHDPWSPDNVPGEYLAPFADVDFALPPNYKAQNDPHADTWAVLGPAQRTKLSEWMRVYYAMTANLDWNVGRLADELDNLGLSENTILVFTSDHGEMFGAQGRRAKNIFYEEAARVPFIVRWPRTLSSGMTPDACLNTPDIMPTLLSLMGLGIPETVEGTDLSHCARGEDGPEPEAAFMQGMGCTADWVDGHEWRAVRTKTHTYARFRVDGLEVLYDNVADPFQTADLAPDPAHGQLLSRLRDLMQQRMSELSDSVEACTWYRDNWTENRIIRRTATLGAR